MSSCSCSVLSRVVRFRQPNFGKSFLVRNLSSSSPPHPSKSSPSEEVPPPLSSPVPPLLNVVEKDLVRVQSQPYPKDDWTNVTERILSQIGRGLHRQKYHPLGMLKHRIAEFFYKNFHGRSMRSPMFSVFDNLNPVVTTVQNFDSLLGISFIISDTLVIVIVHWWSFMRWDFSNLQSLL